MFDNWTNVVAAMVGLAISYLAVTFAFQPKAVRFTVTPPAGKMALPTTPCLRQPVTLKCAFISIH
jgi:hypothetical protein